MKKLFLVFALLSPFFVFGTILTVDNSSNSPGQYTSMSAAYSAAVNGDTIYVRGSLHTYGSITIYKELTIIGAGYNPSPANIYPTTFDNLTIQRSSSSNLGGSGSKIYGIKVKPSGTLHIYGSSYNGNISNVLVERCEARISTYCANGIKIINNIIINLDIGIYTQSNTVVYNNIIKEITFSSGYNSNSLTFDHNIFLEAASSTFRYCIVKNSIFYGTSPGSSATHTAFANNMAYAAPNDTFDISTNSNSGVNNMDHTNPDFVSVASTSFSYFNDYHLQIASAGTNAASDGTNLGIYGGSNPFPIGGASGSGYQTSQEPAVPQVYHFTIQNNIIQPSDTLNVNIKVSIQK